jgi:hypothetical protein
MDAIFFARTDNIVAAIHPGDANRMVDSCTAPESEVNPDDVSGGRNCLRTRGL